MPRVSQSKGTCCYCGTAFAKSGMTRHLTACAKRKAVIQEAQQQDGKAETLHHLVVQDCRNYAFWLHLEMRGSDQLHHLDYYLRRIWLECCGHGSQFSFGGRRGDEVSMTRSMNSVLMEGVELTHLYDFGTTSETSIKAVYKREGKPTSPHPIALMARNLPPEARCVECGLPAARLCIQCLVENGKRAKLCEEHAKTHPHHDYGTPVPLVNSPRVGMCGYDGPAEPPY